MVDKVIVSDVKGLCSKEPIEDMEIAAARWSVEGTQCVVVGQEFIWGFVIMSMQTSNSLFDVNSPYSATFSLSSSRRFF
jgi:hypothetical protein